MHYFRVHTIKVLTDHQLKPLLCRDDFLDRLTKWVVELGEFDIKFQPRLGVKGQVLADFISKFSVKLPQENNSAVVDGQQNDNPP